MGQKPGCLEKKSQCELASGWDEMLLSSLRKKRSTGDGLAVVSLKKTIWLV